MFSPEFARTFHADREREIRKHLRVQGLVRAAKANREHAAAHRTVPETAAWPAADRAASANGSTR